MKAKLIFKLTLTLLSILVILIIIYPKQTFRIFSPLESCQNAIVSQVISDFDSYLIRSETEGFFGIFLVALLLFIIAWPKLCWSIFLLFLVCGIGQLIGKSIGGGKD